MQNAAHSRHDASRILDMARGMIVCTSMQQLHLALEQVDVRYANGPIFAPAQDDAIEDFQALAHFRTELAENGARVGAMIDTPAILSGSLGKGRVLCISPHPESTKALHGMVRRAALWLGKGN